MHLSPGENLHVAISVVEVTKRVDDGRNSDADQR